VTDNTVLASHEFKDRTGKVTKSQFVLTVSNWHFVRDNQTSKQCPPCKPKDCIIGLKLASTAFKVPGATQDLTVAAEPEAEEFCFDRNGLLIPYNSFVYLMTHVEFCVDYMDAVKTEFESHGFRVENDDNEKEIQELIDSEQAARACAAASTEEEETERIELLERSKLLQASLDVEDGLAIGESELEELENEFDDDGEAEISAKTKAVGKKRPQKAAPPPSKKKK